MNNNGNSLKNRRITNIKNVILYSLLFIFVTYAILFSALMISRPISNLFDSNVVKLIMQKTIHLLILIIVCEFFFRVKFLDNIIHREKDYTLIDIFTLIFLLLTVSAVVHIIMFTIENIIENAFNIQLSLPRKESVEMETGITLIETLISSVIFAPILEELIFRCTLFEYLKRKNINIKIIILISALSFSIFHPYSVAKFLSTMAIAVSFSIVYLFSKNVIFPILTHMLWNFSTFPMGLILTFLEEKAGPFSSYIEVYSFIVMFFIFLFCLSLLLLYSRKKRGKFINFNLQTIKNIIK